MQFAQSFGSSPFVKRFGRILRGVIAAVIAIAFVGLVLFLAAMLTATALVIAGAAMLAGGVYWLWRKVRGRKDVNTDPEDPTILVARRGPDGWTVEGNFGG